jgi:chromosome partitioning protein
VVFQTKIRKNIAIAEAPLYTESVLTYAPSSKGTQDYLNLTEEIRGRVNK